MLAAAPVGVADAYAGVEDQPFHVAVDQGLLVNDVDAAGRLLATTLVTGPLHGDVALAADGSLRYTPQADFNGQDEFWYAPSAAGHSLSGFERSKLIAGDGAAQDNFGRQLATDGKTLAVAAPGDDDFGPNAGSVYVFIRVDDQWVFQAKLKALDLESDDRFGSSLAVDGDRIVVGAQEQDSVAPSGGALYVFERSGAEWRQTARLLPDLAEEQLGVSVRLQGNTVVAGALWGRSGSDPAGAVYVFDLVNGAWTKSARLVHDQPHSGDRFGESLDLSGNVLAIGAAGRGLPGAGRNNHGSVYVYERTTAGFVFETELRADDVANGYGFGAGVGVSGDTLLIGARGDAAGPTAYVFVKTESGWTQQAKLQPSESSPQEFGRQVSLRGDVALVGDSYRTYVFQRSQGVWTEQAILRPDPDNNNSASALPMTLGADEVLVAAPWHTALADRSGLVYRYHVDGLATPTRVALQIAPANDPPIAEADHYTALRDQPLDIVFAAAGADQFVELQHIWEHGAAVEPRELTVFRDNLYFTAEHPASGRELWVYDGDRATLLADLVPGETGSNPHDLTVVGDALFFATGDPLRSEPAKLWKYDGAQVELVADAYNGLPFGSISALFDFDGQLVFRAFTTATGHEPFRLDGATVALIAESTPGPASRFDSFNTYFAAFHGELYLALRGSSGGDQMHRFRNGTFTSISSAHLDGSAGQVIVYQDALYFVARGTQPVIGDTGQELWRYDGKSSKLAIDLMPGAESSQPTWLTPMGDDLVFNAHWPGRGKELVRFDGQQANLVAELNPGMGSTNIHEMQVLGDDLYLRAFAGSDYGFWRYAADSTTQLSFPGSLPPESELTAFRGALLYVTRNAEAQPTLWKFDPAPAQLGVLANDHDVDGDRLTAELVESPTHGSVRLQADGAFVYVPEAAYVGPDSFVYRNFDGQAYSQPATVTIQVEALPTALADQYEADEEIPLEVNAAAGLLANDALGTGLSATVHLARGPEHGELTLAADGSFRYVSDADYQGADSFSYRVQTSVGWSEEAEVRLRVKPVNDPPVAAGDQYDLSLFGTLIVPVSRGVLNNDSDIDGGALSAQLVEGPAHGVLALLPDGGFEYRAHPDWLGEDSFSYSASDGQASSPPTTVRLVRSTTGNPNDFNGDGRIDLSDFGLLKQNFGQTGPQVLGDSTRDGRVDLSDFALFKENFGRSAAASDAVAATTFETAAARPNVHLVRDLATTGADPSSYPNEFVVYQDWVYFRAVTGNPRLGELWRFRGSAVTLEPVLDNQGRRVVNATGFAEAGGVLYFRSGDPSLGQELWRTDGTPQGTHLVADLAPKEASSSPENLTAVGGMLYFTTTQFLNGADFISSGTLWRSDGTAVGTYPITGGDAGPVVTASQLHTDGARLYFIGSSNVSPSNGDPKLWTSDGTRTGTRQVFNSTPGNNYESRTGTSTSFQGYQWFTARDDAQQTGLYRTDGTPAGTVLVREVLSPLGRLTILGVLGDKLMLAVDDGQNGGELWSSDGTALGTQPVYEVAGLAGLGPGLPTVAGNLMYFVPSETPGFRSLWRTDGTSEGTFRLTSPEVWVATLSFIPLDGQLYFTVIDEAHGLELWSTDGTVAGTDLVKDVRPGAATSNAEAHLGWDGLLFFSADDGVHGQEPWVVDTVALGDADRDGRVDLGDFGVLKAHFGTGTLRSEGDFNRNGRIDLADFGILKTSFGRQGGDALLHGDSTGTPPAITPQAVDLAFAAIGSTTR